MFKCYTIILILLFTAGCTKEEDTSELKLWYLQPAEKWTEALPIGNGRLGAMIFGDPINERIQLNEESLWAGSYINSNNPEALKNLPKVRELLLEGKLDEAKKLATQTMLSAPINVRSNQTLGDLLIDYQNGEATEYIRELDLTTGISKTQFAVNSNQITQEVFASAPDDLIIIRLKAEKRSKIYANIRLHREKDAETEISENGLMMKGQINDQEDPRTGPGGLHMKFCTTLKIIPTGGTFSFKEKSIKIEGAREVLLLLTAATDYNISKLNFDSAIDPVKKCTDILEKTKNKTYQQLLKTHLEEYKRFFDRVSIDLGKNKQETLPTDRRLQKMKEGEDDPQMMALYFQYGRYLLMSSSRKPCVLPANLQGIWNKEFNAPWNADFHTNINLQMNYWPAGPCNLSETMLPLVHFIDRLQTPGAKTAHETYGARGWTVHHLTDPFGRTAIMDGIWGCFPMGGPWMAFQMYELYAYTGDRSLLENKIYPMMKSSAQFVIDFLIRDRKGQWVTAPSNSPENTFIDPVSGNRSNMTYAATMDIQIITELFKNCIHAAGVLNTDHAFADTLTQILRELPPIKVSNRNNGIQEWIEDYEEAEPGHRHMSHLLGLHPGTQITPETPELFEAAKKTLQNRLSSGGGHTGWSRAWIINFYARLYDGESAHHHIKELLNKSTLPNLFDDHPPFQIDGNFGGTAGIAEMLLQSHSGNITVLPALPKAWHTGSVKGLLARGGFETDISWANGNLDQLTIRSKLGNPLLIKYKEFIVQNETEPGKTYKFVNHDGKMLKVGK